jgi:hypothetical protein
MAAEDVKSRRLTDQGVPAELAARFWRWLCLVAGVACLFGAGVLAVHAVQQAMEISAYHNARTCPAGAPPGADCLQSVNGTVTAVTEFPGAGRVSADYALDVRTASTTLDLGFTSDSAMLGYAADGNPAVVTMWRGVAVSVMTDGRSEVTVSVPETALARDLGNGEEAGAVGVFLLFTAWGIGRNRRYAGVQQLRPLPTAALTFLLLGSIAVAFGGIALGGRPSRLAPDLAATGAGLVLVLGLSVWIGLKSRARGFDAELRHAKAVTDGAQHAPYTSSSPANHAPLPPPPAHLHAASTAAPLRMRLHLASRVSVLGTYAAAWLGPALTVAVLFGVFFTSHDGPAARSYRHAPACVGEANLATCAGDFTAEINGVRAPANGANFATVSYATEDGAINTWAKFDGNAAAIARTAEADMHSRALLRIRVWRQSIVGAQLGGHWQWADGNPPGNMIPAVFLAVSFAALLLGVRLRIHRRARPQTAAGRLQLLIDDAGQAIGAAAAVVLLAYGFWPGAIPALAALLWLGYSAGRSTVRSRRPLTALHSR